MYKKKNAGQVCEGSSIEYVNFSCGDMRKYREGEGEGGKWKEEGG